MRDMVMIIIITLYFFLLSITLTSIYDDDIMTGSSFNVNSSINNNLTYYSNITSDITDENIGSGISFVSMLGRIITFRIPKQTGFPNFIIRLIELINFILVLILGLLIYRLIRSGAG